MASLIKTAINDILTRLNTVTGAMFVAVWNNHASRLMDGSGYSFACPAVFVELETLGEAGRLGGGMTSQDYIIRIHLLHQELDAADGTLDQNLNVYDWRDDIKAKVTGMKPTNFSNLMFMNELQDYEHSNLYHYILEFKAAFVDTKGSPIDNDSTDWIETTPPTDLDLSVTYDEPPYLKGS